MFDTPTHAREAMTRIRENHPDWKPSFARKEVEEKIIETVGDESNVGLDRSPGPWPLD